MPATILDLAKMRKTLEERKFSNPKSIKAIFIRSFKECYFAKTNEEYKCRGARWATKKNKRVRIDPDRKRLGDAYTKLVVYLEDCGVGGDFIDTGTMRQYISFALKRWCKNEGTVDNVVGNVCSVKIMAAFVDKIERKRSKLFGDRSSPKKQQTSREKHDIAWNQ